MSDRKQRSRKDYAYFQSYRIRWSDNDQYSHVNNTVYYLWFDSIINTYLIDECGQLPDASPMIGLVVSSYCEYFAPVSFPGTVDLGLRVTKLGNSSVTYEVGVFAAGSEKVAAVGGFTHVFVERVQRKSGPMGSRTREGLAKILAVETAPVAKL